MKGSLVAVGALLVLGGGAALGYGLTRKPTGGMTPQAQQAMGSAVSSLDGDVKAARATVKRQFEQAVNSLIDIRRTRRGSELE